MVISPETTSASSPEEYENNMLLPEALNEISSCPYLFMPLPTDTILVVADSVISQFTAAVTSSLVFEKRILSENELPILVTIDKTSAMSKSVMIISIRVKLFFISIIVRKV